MINLLALGFAAFAGIMALLNSLATTRRAWLAGSTLLSLSIGASIWLQRPSYLILLITAMMVLADIIIYLFGRSFALFSEAAPARSLSPRLYRVTLIFQLVCLGAFFAYKVFTGAESVEAGSISRIGLGAFHQFLWGDAWLYVLFISLLLVLVVFGAFFMVAKED